MAAMRRAIRVISVIFVVLIVGLVALWAALRHATTPTTPGPDAEALAQEMVRAVDGDAWSRTGAVRWRMLGHAHLWDRQRGLARVEWHKNRVLLDVGAKKGRAWSNDAEVTDGAARQKLVDDAYALFVNDMFWLNPMVKAFDDGTSRERGSVDGKRALLVAYASGGVTPGDKYLWILDDNGRPLAWRVWVQILKIGGLEFSWEGWTRLSTGAWVSTAHKIAGLGALKLTDLAAGATLHDLETTDPFAPLR